MTIIEVKQKKKVILGYNKNYTILALNYIPKKFQWDNISFRNQEKT